jgi:hypothetical protein
MPDESQKETVYVALEKKGYQPKPQKVGADPGLQESRDEKGNYPKHKRTYVAYHREENIIGPKYSIKFQNWKYETANQDDIDLIEKKMGLIGKGVWLNDWPPEIKHKMKEDKRYITRDLTEFEEPS